MRPGLPMKRIRRYALPALALGCLLVSSPSFGVDLALIGNGSLRGSSSSGFQIPGASPTSPRLMFASGESELSGDCATPATLSIRRAAAGSQGAVLPERPQISDSQKWVSP